MAQDTRLRRELKIEDKKALWQSPHTNNLLKMVESSGIGHPTGGRKRKYKNPAVSSAGSLPLPRLPDHLIDGPSCDEEESEAKRPRSTSTTPKSGREMDPDECDRLMGIISVDLSSEEDRFGDGELTDTENPISRVADDSGAPVESHFGIGSCSGAADRSRGHGSASLAEILNRDAEVRRPWCLRISGCI